MRDFAFLLWPFVAGYAIWRFAQVLELFAPAPPVRTEPYELVVPDDITGWVAGYPEPWAQEDAMKSIRERYAESRDWNIVRRGLGLAPSDG